MKIFLVIIVLSSLLITKSFASEKIELICEMDEIVMENKRSPYNGGNDILIIDVENKKLDKGVWSGGGQITQITNERIEAKPRHDQFVDGWDRWFTLNRYTGELSVLLDKKNGEKTWFYGKCKPGKKLF